VRNLLQDFDEAISNDDKDYFSWDPCSRSARSGHLTDSRWPATTGDYFHLAGKNSDKLHALGRNVSANTIDTDFLRNPDRQTEAMVQRLTLNDQDNDFFVRSIISASGDTNAPPNAKRNVAIQS